MCTEKNDPELQRTFYNKHKYGYEKHLSTLAELLSFFFSAIKEERFRFGNGYDQVEDVVGVAQPVRFNSKRHASFQLIK